MRTHPQNMNTDPFGGREGPGDTKLLSPKWSGAETAHLQSCLKR